MNIKFYTALAVAGAVCFSAGIAEAQTAPAKSAPKDHHDSTFRKDLGTTTIAGLKIEKVTQEGRIVPGHEGAFDIIIGEGQPEPNALRAWIGVESGKGSAKGKLEKEPNRHYHSHVRVPDPIPAGSRYWLEVEPASGSSGKASFKFFTEE